MTLLLLALLPIIIFFSILIRFLKETWWRPWRIKEMMGSQGIRGPPYRFMYGNTREAAGLIARAMAAPMELSHDILPRVHPHLHSWINTYGRNYFTWLGTQPRLFIGEPELIKEMLVNKEASFVKGPPTFFFKKLLGLGLVTAAGGKWARQRRLASRSFSFHNVKGMLPVIVTSTEMMMKKWEEKEGVEIDLANEFIVLTSDIISRVAFGSSYLEGKIIFSKLEDLIVLFAKNSQKTHVPLIGKFIKSRDDMESERSEKCLKELLKQLIDEREKKRRIQNREDGFGSDFLGSLLDAMHDADQEARVTMEDVIDECKTFYVAGHETTQCALVWTTLLLAVNPDWQEKARKEVLQLLGRNHPSESRDVNKLKTMGMIINESLRLYPPAPYVIRNISREEKLGNIVLPAGTDVAVSILALHHDPDIWGEDVHCFRPERFAEGTARASNKATAFMPFGMGPRTCVGLNFAMMEMKVVLSMVLQKYVLVLSPAYTHSPVQRLTLGPQHGMQLLLHKL